MAKVYAMGSELKTLGVLPIAPKKTKLRYGKLDENVVVKKSNNYVHYAGSVLTPSQKRSNTIYHATKGKNK